MNQTRRNKIREIQEELRAISEKVEQLRDEESDAYESMPESLQESDRGRNVIYAAGTLENALDQVNDSVDTLDDIFED